MMTAARKQRTAPRPSTRSAAQRAPGTQATVARTPLNQMTPDELCAWIHETRRALKHKQARARAYLDRRADRGMQTPTDEAYEQDQRLLADLLAMLDEMERTL
jgi:molecular chaperone GrpE (heat shock protein)